MVHPVREARSQNHPDCDLPLRIHKLKCNMPINGATMGSALLTHISAASDGVPRRELAGKRYASETPDRRLDVVVP